MGAVKELWCAAHDQLIEEYMEEHPDATEEEAVDATADHAQDRMVDTFMALADAAHDRRKEQNGTN